MSTSPRRHRGTAILFCCLYMPLMAAWAEPSLTGQSGLISMPDARIEPDGELRVGYAWDDPYRTFWGSVTLLPSLEVSGRYTRISHVQGFANNSKYGDYKDKAFDAKWMAFEETDWLPQVAIGTQDFLGTQLFGANYIAFSKRVSAFDLTLGYGTDRLSGVFGGARFKPDWLGGAALLVERNTIDYAADPFAAESGAAERKGGWAYGLEYRDRLWGAQLSTTDGQWQANLFLSLPLMAPEFVPKINEPAPYKPTGPQVPVDVWLADASYQRELVDALLKQGFRNVRLALDGTTLRASISNGRITRVGRAVGRAARTIVLGGPKGLERIEITYLAADMPLLSYQFQDIRGLELYFAGKLPLRTLRNSVAVYNSDPDYFAFVVREDLLDFDDKPDPAIEGEITEESKVLALRTENTPGSSLTWSPVQLDTFFNDPSGALRYDVYTRVSASRQLGDGLYASGSARASIYENISGVTQPSNSLLPHVRSDVAEYKSGQRVRVDRLLLNQFYKPAKEWYARGSAGYYEEMFAGAGGQLLYWPEERNWAFDIAVDALRQRDPYSAFGFRDYNTLTGIASLHYRLPELGVTATLRAGRFLAKDDGVRFELSRRFDSGVEIGIWYTMTNGDDITSPGSPSNPYYDKGFFVTIPMSSLLTRDTRSTAGMALSPWSRDVGQMVVSPSDLYRLVEFNRPNSMKIDPMTGFGR
ncbi:YjbH domain-containing protein [Plasticicumulans acidivorans]|uniref:Exopolysaccharide biosynthesis protein YbjH n=1 Tax=Plasticicumulans acidivorans TaxID=886464 RepID=A0A317MZK4_9GAMM|nr:YjbH domain-containing protein [Plasticicumulans acidivorans]PWV65637.1 exopolysaccharide biosynthesis protein YbjH [Plasticicumulans acidivorans]